jgi:hypothetical protein
MLNKLARGANVRPCRRSMDPGAGMTVLGLAVCS